jgi:hypothetical protein
MNDTTGRLSPTGAASRSVRRVMPLDRVMLRNGARTPSQPRGHQFEHSSSRALSPAADAEGAGGPGGPRNPRNADTGAPRLYAASRMRSPSRARPGASGAWPAALLSSVGTTRSPRACHQRPRRLRAGGDATAARLKEPGRRASGHPQELVVPGHLRGRAVRQGRVRNTCRNAGSSVSTPRMAATQPFPCPLPAQPPPRA